MKARKEDLAEARRIIVNGYPIGPRLQPCVCGAGRHAHGGAKQNGTCPATGCQRYRRDKADELAEQAMYATRDQPAEEIADWHAALYPRPKPAPGGWGVGPSDTSTCQKQIQFRERPPADLIVNEISEAAATLGNIFHDVLTRARARTYWWRKYEFSIDIPNLDRPGRVDEYDPVTAIVTDYKTTGEWAWERLGLYGPKDTDWEQLAIYGYGLICAGYEVDTLELLYIRRATGKAEVFSRPYREIFAKAALAKLTAIILALDMGADLPRDGRGPTSDPICKSFCRFRDYCWNVAAAEAAGRSPESYTILGPHPDMEAIEWAAGLARGWKDTGVESDREYKAAVPLLAGVSDGTYGDFIVKEKVRSMPEYKDFYTQVRAAQEGYLNEDPAVRGDFADWMGDIQLKYRRDVYPEIKHVRHAAKISAPRKKKTTPKETTS